MSATIAPTGEDVRATDERPRSAIRAELAEHGRAVRHAAITAHRGGLFRTDLTLPQLRALLLVDAHPGLTSRALADELSLSGPGVCALVDRLVRRGLLDRRECASDRRLRVLDLTPAGRELLDESEGFTTAYYLRLFDCLSDDDLAELNRLFGVIADAAQLGPPR